jgi:hypothetical protein
MIDFNTARSKLNISEEQFHALDKLDGQKDDLMSESIFSQAKAYRQSQYAYNPYNTVSNEVKEILDRGITYWNEPKPGTNDIEFGEGFPMDAEDFVLDENGNEVELRIYDEENDPYGSNRQFYARLASVTEHIGIYYAKHGKLDGCDSLKELPEEIEFVSYDFEYFYNDKRNDDAKFVNDVPVYTRNPDGIYARLTFSFQGEKYTFTQRVFIKNSFGV